MNHFAIPVRLQKENLSAEEQVELAALAPVAETEAESAARAARASAAQVEMTKAAALKEILACGVTLQRCLLNGVAFPQNWITYHGQVRAVYESGVGPLPEKPAYPEGS